MTDPTGTVRLRKSFWAEGNRRLAALRSQTHTILVEHDLMAARRDPLADLLPNPGHRLPTFVDWFERTAKYWLLGEEWWGRFIERAYESGAVAGNVLVGSPPRSRMSVPAVYRELAQREFAGIVAVMVQQVARQATNAAVRKVKPPMMYRQVLAVLKKIGLARLKLAVNSLTVQMHNVARVQAFREAGVTRIGIFPEMLEPMKPSRFLKHDHKPLDVQDKVSEATLQEIADAEARVESAQEAVAEAENEREQATAAADEARRAADAAEKDAAQAELNASQAEATSEVARQRAQTAQEEVNTVEGEVAQAEANAALVRAGDPEDRNYEARVAQAELMVERADAKMARAEDKADQLEQEATQAESDAARLQEEFETAQAEAQSTAADAEQADAEQSAAEEALAEARTELDAAMEALREAQLKAEQEEEEDLVSVQTAGDDKVCVACLELAAGGPYELDEAESLLPVHPNCRCSWVPVNPQEEDSWWRRLLGTLGL
jgi:hypothetical protein